MTVPNHVLQVSGLDYLKGATDETMRSSMFFGYLQESGRVTPETGGYKWIRAVRYKKSTGRGYQRGASIGYSPKDEHVNVNFDMRKMMDDDSIDLLDVIENSGDNQLVDLFATKYPNLADGMRERLQRGVFLDGSDAENADQLNGIETVFTQDLTVTVATADKVAIPSTTYRGQSTRPGAKGGAWSEELDTPMNAEWDNDWPFGNGDAQYDYYSPKLWHTLADWDNTTNTWADNCLDILTAAIQTTELSSGEAMIPKVVPMGDSMMIDFKKKLRATQREVLPHVRSRDMGFAEAIEFEGAATKKDFFCPSDAAYVLNPAASELIYVSKAPKGFEHVGKGGIMFGFGPTQGNLATFYGMGVFFFGDLWFRPKHMAKIADFAVA